MLLLLAAEKHPIFWSEENILAMIAAHRYVIEGARSVQSWAAWHPCLVCGLEAQPRGIDANKRPHPEIWQKSESLRMPGIGIGAVSG